MSLDAIKLSEDALEFNDAPAQVWMRVRDAEKLIYSRNPKRHDFGALITSLARYGYQETAKYDAALKAIKAGNGRIEALAKMERDGKYALPRGLAKHRQTGEWCLPILMGTDAPSETEALAYLVDANNITMLGGDLGMHEMARMWEEDIYAGILKDLQEAELPPVSMDHDDITAFLNTLENGNGVAANDDDHAGELVDKAEELQKKWQVQPGDLWECGEHRIVCGDCNDSGIMTRLLGDKKAKLLLTDPPYGIKITRKSNKFGDSPHKSRKANNQPWDDKAPSAQDIKILMLFSENQIIFGANYFWDAFYSSQCYIIWDKRGDLPDVPFAPTEFAWTSFVDRPSKKYTIINHGFIREEKTTEYHPTQKPVKLFSEVLDDFSEIGDLVYDPFLGSGTTMIACENLKRKCRAIELNPAYVAVALQRWSDLTGKIPRRIETKI